MRKTGGLLAAAVLCCTLGCRPSREGTAELRGDSAPAAAGAWLAPSRAAPDAPRSPAEAAGADKQEPWGLTAGVRPFFLVERTNPPDSLEADGPLAYELGLFANAQDGAGRLSLTYAPLKEEDTDREVRCLWLDLAAGPNYSLWDGAVSGMVRAEFGLSLLYMDFEKDNYDMYGAGATARAVFGLYAIKGALGLELSADGHGWLGGDSRDFQTAWAATLGASLTLKF